MMIQRYSSLVDILSFRENNPIIVTQPLKKCCLLGDPFGQHYIVRGKVNNVFALSQRKASIKRGAVPQILRKKADLYTICERVFLQVRPNLLNTPISASVVHDNQFY